MAENVKRPVGRPRKKIEPVSNIVKSDSSIIEPHKQEKGARNPMWIEDTIMKLQMFQIRVDLNRWIAAVNQAESVLLPDRTEMMQVYKDITLDAHLSGVMNAIKNKIKSKEYQLIDQKGNENENAYEIFEQQWFLDWIDAVIESVWYGFSLVQLGAIRNNTFVSVEQIARQYVVPEWDLVKHTLYITARDGGTNYREDKKYEPWLIMIDNKDIGLLNKCVPHMIGKKNVNLFWWQYSELFGAPLRKGTTDIRDVLRRKNMENMMINMGNAGWAVMDTDDNIDFIETSRTDAYNIYKEAIELANKEVSKLLAGQTMMFDSGSSRSQGEVHQDLFDDILSSFLRKIRYLTNTDLIPKMIKLGIKGLDGLHFRYEYEDDVKFENKVKLVHDLGQVGYKFDPNFVDQYLDLGAKGKIEVVQQMQQLNPKQVIEESKNIAELPWFNYLQKIDEMRSDKSKMEQLKNMYKKHK
jgi:hypothetical protein